MLSRSMHLIGIGGDAVYTETTKSNFGRGRIPRFVLTTQMNILSKNKIKYERQPWEVLNTKHQMSMRRDT